MSQAPRPREAGASLKFQTLQSSVDASFWARLRDKKLKDHRLSEEPLPVAGSLSASNHEEVPSPFRLDQSSFDAQVDHALQGCYALPGTLLILNTIEGFKAFDRSTAIQQAAASIWEAIGSGRAEENPELLSPFLLHTYADLKKYTFFYWFAFPVIKPPTPFQGQAAVCLDKAFGEGAAIDICAACDTWRSRGSPQHLWLLRLPSTGGGRAEALPLSCWRSVASEGDDWALAVADTSHAIHHPGWLLRNALLMAAARWRLEVIKVICVRELRGRAIPTRCALLEVDLPPIPADWEPQPSQVVGWEVNAKGKPGPRVADVGAFMDPCQLAESAVDLNLSLMRWRAAPSLDVGRLATTKCLLLGAGTLGCAVARTLLGWGVRSMTLVDSGRVAFSNPVRQSLYTFEDCLDGGRPKAEAAAEAIRAIFPGCRVEGRRLAIAMPGHPLAAGEAEEVRKGTEALEAMVKDHDVIFLLTDTRESRWLPTLLATAHNKLAINAALGYDGLLVMRHGSKPPDDENAASARRRLGCYFCNDVVAPLDSTRNRAMDQQCTVARPGLAPIAGSLAVELMASVLQHPLGVDAPAAEEDPPVDLPLGHPPHMVRNVPFMSPVPRMLCLISSLARALCCQTSEIRMYLSSFSQHSLEGRAFSQCTACSSTVVGRFRDEGWGFLQQVFNDPSFLEDLTGLAKLHEETSQLCLGMAEGDAASNDGWAEL